MIEKFPKFIIEDGRLKIGLVALHNELAYDVCNVKGGGWYKKIKEDLIYTKIIFYGKSKDFGKAEFNDIKECIRNKNVFDYNGNQLDCHYHFNYENDEGCIKYFSGIGDTYYDLQEYLSIPENLKETKEYFKKFSDRDVKHKEQMKRFHEKIRCEEDFENFLSKVFIKYQIKNCDDVCINNVFWIDFLNDYAYEYGKCIYYKNDEIDFKKYDIHSDEVYRIYNRLFYSLSGQGETVINIIKI